MGRVSAPKDRRQDRHLSRLMHVHRFDECQLCGRWLTCPCLTGGRPQQYCSDAHRQQAYRLRRAAAGAAPGPRWRIDSWAVGRRQAKLATDHGRGASIAPFRVVRPPGLPGPRRRRLCYAARDRACSHAGPHHSQQLSEW